MTEGDDILKRLIAFAAAFASGRGQQKKIIVIC